jgi:hypothetical protein
MFRLVKSEVRSLTPELAQEFKDLEPSPTERDLSASRVKHLMDKALADPCRLVTFHWSVAKLGNKRLRMNGQHSSNMLCELNGKFPKGLKVHLDEYEVEKDEDFAMLFQQFDDRKSGRTAGDVSGAWQGLYEPVRSVPKAAAKLSIDGVVWWRQHIEGVPVKTGDEAYSLFGETGLHAYIRWVGEVLSIKTPELKRAQIASAMYATFATNETAARAFWEQVARGGVEYEDNAPATILDGWLKSLADKEKRNALPPLKPANYYQACIYAWNAFREEKPLKDIKFDTKKGFNRVVE